jgi:isoleucyl-tRNA synthetase
MSKSVGNVISPQEIIDKHGAEILRIWTSAVDYRDDIRISDEIVSRIVEAYRRIRNTCRFILGNLGGFSPADAVSPGDMLPLDRFALDSVIREHDRMCAAYEKFEFHKVFHGLHNLCVTDLSAFYLDIIKDRLYVSGEKSLERRSAQTALWLALQLMTRDMAPILSFTAEEVFGHTPPTLRGDAASVFLADEPDLAPWRLQEAERTRFERVTALRGEITKAIEPRRKAGEIGHSLETRVEVFLPDALADELGDMSGVDLREICIVSQVNAARAANADIPPDAYRSEDIPGLAIAVAKAQGGKCSRCWIVSAELGTDPEHPEICPRCTQVLHDAEAAS